MLLINRRRVLAVGGTLAATLIARKPRAEELDDVAGALKPTNPSVVAPNVAFQSGDGAEHHLADFLGHGMVINLWATWCGPCVAEVPNVVKTYEKLHPKGFEIVGISFDADKERLQKFVADKEMTWPQYFDGGVRGPVSTLFAVHAIPHTFTVDADGVLPAV